MKWKTLLRQYTDKITYMKLNPPATESAITEIEEKLRLKLPSDLASLLRECNGDDFLLLSAEQILEINLMLRTFDFCMPLDCFLFFGGNGCGDYYGYPITREDGIRDGDVFLWNHENDSREWKASGLEDAIIEYYNSEI